MLDQVRVQPLRDLEWPTEKEIREVQKEHSLVHCEKDGKIVIPDEAVILKTRLLIIAHAGPRGGHYARDLTLRTLGTSFIGKE